MKIKKAVLTGVASIVAAIARAYTGIIIGLLVILVGAFVIWRLIELINEVLPANPPGTQGTNNVTVWIVTNVATGPVSMSVKVQTASPKVASIASPQMVFTFQYGVSNSLDAVGRDQTWTAAGSSFPPTIDGSVNMVADTSTRLAFTVPFGGSAVVCDIGFDADGNQTYYLSYVDPPHTVAIERSVDMVNWVQLFANTNCGLNAVQTFIDSNAPPIQAFYRSVEYTNQPTLTSQ